MATKYSVTVTADNVQGPAVNIELNIGDIINNIVYYFEIFSNITFKLNLLCHSFNIH